MRQTWFKKTKFNSPDLKSIYDAGFKPYPAQSGVVLYFHLEYII